MHYYPLLKEIKDLKINGHENTYQQLAEAVLLDEKVVNEIINLAALKYGVDSVTIRQRSSGENTTNAIRRARYWTAFSLREYGLTFNTIARILGGVDFTVAVFAYTKGRELK